MVRSRLPEIIKENKKPKQSCLQEETNELTIKTIFLRAVNSRNLETAFKHEIIFVRQCDWY